MPHESTKKIRVYIYLAIYFIIRLGHKLKLGLILSSNGEEEKETRARFIINTIYAFHILSIYLSVYLSIYLRISMALQPFVGPWRLFQFIDLLHCR
jgi:hypothetical protein